MFVKQYCFRNFYVFGKKSKTWPNRSQKECFPKLKTINMCLRNDQHFSKKVKCSNFRCFFQNWSKSWAAFITIGLDGFNLRRIIFVTKTVFSLLLAYVSKIPWFAVFFQKIKLIESGQPPATKLPPPSFILPYGGGGEENPWSRVWIVY